MSGCILFVSRIVNLHGSGELIALFGCCMAGATGNAAVSAQGNDYYWQQSDFTWCAVLQERKKKKKTRYKNLVTHVESHASAVSLLKRAENSYISDNQKKKGGGDLSG